jgi:hypothetical protein
MLVLMALASNVMTTPGLKRWLPKLGQRDTAETPDATAGTGENA